MKKYITALLFISVFATISCVKNLEEEGISSTTECIGTVVEKSTNEVLPNIKVKVTDGDHIYAFTSTGPDGAFSLKVNFDEVDESYYLLLDGSPSLPVKQEPLLGIGYKIYDYKILALYDKTDTALLPKVVTGEVTDTLGQTATVSGSVISCGGNTLIERGICYATHQEPKVEDLHVSAGSEIGDFSCSLMDLQYSTRYYYRAYATNDYGSSYGIQKTFITGNGKAKVRITSVTDVTSSSAVCGGKVTSDGGSRVTARGICCGTSQYPLIENSPHVLPMGEDTGSFVGSITGLSVNTTYYVRAYATNANGTEYSEPERFTTTSGLPDVTTNTVSSVTVTSAVCGGVISSDGGFPITDKGLVWSSISNPPTLNDSRISMGEGNDPFSTTMTGLAPATTYYVCAYATNANGTVYGKVNGVGRSFTTPDGKPTVTTTSPVRNDLTVVTGGTVSDDGGYEVTSRGICYGLTANPDLGPSYSQITDGNGGRGSFTSTFTLPGPGVYYIRAYATNSMGTKYGQQVTVRHPYNELPTFTYGGQTYRVAPAATNNMIWSDANDYCNNLSLYGFTDWRLPSKDELMAMCSLLNTRSYWWSGTVYNSSSHYYLYCSSNNWHAYYAQNNYLYSVRPVRVEN
ncbi:MAG: DUF1566 domain-containing protein [Bacteroidales bacterium]|nr:DUF1566 domain-containing protein [Bacteroidales bacterium]